MTTAELYERLAANPDLRGEIALEDDLIIWRVTSALTLDIAVSYKDTYVGVNGALHHWHPDEDDIYDDLCAIGKRGNILVIRKTLASSEVFYSGAASEYRFSPNKKWHWGRLYYFGG